MSPIGPRFRPRRPAKVRGLLRRCLEKDPGQRLQTIAEARQLIDRLLSGGGARRVAIAAVAAAVVTAAVFTVASPWREASVTRLTDQDVVVLADFANTTGDAVFDVTLREAPAFQLEQSPFLKILSDQRVRETLQLMKRGPDTRITNDIAREICQRENDKAMIDGSIASLANAYVITVRAIDCQSGDTLARQQATAADGTSRRPRR